MTTLTVTAKGQVTLKREILEHLGVQPGDRIEVDLLPGQRVGIMPGRRGEPISALFGTMPGRGAQPSDWEAAAAMAVLDDDDRIRREWREPA